MQDKKMQMCWVFMQYEYYSRAWNEKIKSKNNVRAFDVRRNKVKKPTEASYKTFLKNDLLFSRMDLVWIVKICIRPRENRSNPEYLEPNNVKFLTRQVVNTHVKLLTRKIGLLTKAQDKKKLLALTGVQLILSLTVINVDLLLHNHTPYIP